MSNVLQASTTTGSIAPVDASTSLRGCPVIESTGLHIAHHASHCSPLRPAGESTHSIMISSRLFMQTRSNASRMGSRKLGNSAPPASTNAFGSAYRSTVWNAEKSTGSGALEKQVPKVSG